MSAIIARLLPYHDIYVEPFCGGAAVFFRKRPSSKEVLNDLNPDVAFIYRFIRDHTSAQREALRIKDWTLTLSRFQALTQTKPEDPVERFYRFMYLTLGSRNYERLEVNSDYVGERIEVAEYLPQWQKRLNRVEVLNMDYSVVLEMYDSPDTLFYIDPPYWQYEWKASDPFCKENWEELIRRLQRLKAKVLLSEAANCSALPSCWERRLIHVANNVVVEGKLQHLETEEWLFANYSLP